MALAFSSLCLHHKFCNISNVLRDTVNILIIATATMLHPASVISRANYSWDVGWELVCCIKTREIKTEPFDGTIMFFWGLQILVRH